MVGNMLIGISTNVFIKIAIFASISMLVACEKVKDQPTKSDVRKEQAENVFNFQTNAGWIHGNCLAIKRELESGEKVTVVILGPKAMLQETKVASEATAESGCFALFDDKREINQAEDRRFYLLDKLENNSDFLAIGMVDVHGSIKMVGNVIDSDLDADSKKEVYSSCETSEGINFSVWAEKVNKDVPLWSDYYYLGYDLQPTCP